MSRRPRVGVSHRGGRRRIAGERPGGRMVGPFQGPRVTLTSDDAYLATPVLTREVSAESRLMLERAAQVWEAHHGG